jgi:hypothetical protein
MICPRLQRCHLSQAQWLDEELDRNVPCVFFAQRLPTCTAAFYLVHSLCAICLVHSIDPIGLVHSIDPVVLVLSARPGAQYLAHST